MGLSNNQRKSALAKIHLAKKQLGLDDDTYRAMLQSIGGVTTSANLTDQGLDNVIKHLAQCGVQFTKKPKRAIGKAPHNLNSEAEKAKLMQKIGALLADQKLSWNYALGIARQMFRKEALEFCTGQELWAIVNALIQRQKKGNTHAKV